MMKIKNTALCAGVLAAALTLQPAVALGAFSSEDIGTSCAQFLEIGQGARAVAMGEAYGAVADDGYALYWNPAGLGMLQDKKLDLGYTLWLEKVTNGYFSYAHPVPGWNSTFAVSVDQLSTPAVDKYDNTGTGVGDTFSAADMAVTLGWGKKVTETLSSGISAKMIQSTIDNTSASAFAVDLGLLYRPGKQSFCVVLQNFGTKMKYVSQESALPLNLKVGTAYPFSPNLLVAMDLNAPSDNEIRLNVGCEYTKALADTLSAAFRIGAKTNVRGLDSASAISLGLGMQWSLLNLDVAWVPYGDLGSTIRTSIGFRFGSSAAASLKQTAAGENRADAVPAAEEITPAPKAVNTTVKTTAKTITKTTAKTTVKTAAKKSSSELKKEYFAQGEQYFNAGNYPEALENFNKVLELDPTHTSSLEYVSRIRAKQKYR